MSPASLVRLACLLLPTALLAISGCRSSSDASSSAPVYPDRVFSFEDRVPSASVLAPAGGSLQLSDARYVHGRHSLVWDWQDGEALALVTSEQVLTRAEARELWLYGHAIFAGWFYLEQAHPGATLRIEFGRGDAITAEADCWFDMGLDFTGWRAARVAYDHDMQGKHQGQIDWIRLRPPVGTGRIFLDKLIPVAPDDQRFQWRDHQLPELKSHMEHEPATVLDLATIAPPTPAELTGAEAITVRATAMLDDELRSRTLALEALRNRLDDLQLEVLPTGLRGRHVTLHDLVKPDMLRREDGGYYSQLDIERNGSVGFRETQQLLLDLAIASKQPAHAENRAELEQAFLLLNRHLLDQGWAVGSSRGTTHHFGYASREWFRASLLMRRELADAGMLQPTLDALRWYMLEFLDIAEPPPAPPIDCNMDYLNTVARSQVFLIAAHPDGPVKVELLRRLRAYLDAIMGEPTPGLRGGFKPDGTTFHHGGHYPAYAFGGMRGAVSLLALLDDTPFALSPGSHANVRDAVRAAWLYSNGTVPLALCGRHPFRMPAFAQNGSGLYYICRDLARIGTPAGEPIDHEMAGIFLASHGLDESASDEIFGARIAPLTPPDGHWSYNYGCFGIHRHAGRLVTLKGFSRDVWATEIYAGYQKPGGNNNFGVYQSHGAVQVMLPDGPEASGLQAAGWDWTMNPGTTTIHYPIMQLKNPQWRTFMPKTGGKWTRDGETNVAGSAQLGQRYGVFAMELVPTNPENAYSQPPYDSSFRAYKSAFAIDDRIICLGAGIANADTEHPTRTTLFQLGLGDATPPTWFDSPEPITAFPASGTGQGGLWLQDHLGQGYVLEAGDDVRLQRSIQSSRNDANTADTHGRFATAWIEHGTAPQDAGYVYTILLDSDADSTALYAASLAGDAPPYRILRRDRVAHVLRDRTTGIVGYAIFEAAADLPADGPVAAVSATSLVMAKPSADGELDLAVCDPTLHLAPAHGGSQVSTVELRLRGRWRILAGGDQATADLDDQDTLLRVRCQHGFSRQLRLAPMP